MIYWITALGFLSLGSALTRFFPFLFGKRLSNLAWVRRLGVQLPGAIMLLLVVYSLHGSYHLSEGVGIAIVILAHTLFRNTLLSIGLGTATYILMTCFVSPT